VAELPEVREQRRAERAAATRQSEADLKKAGQQIQSMDATAGMIDQLAKAEADVRLAGDQVAVEKARRARLELEATADLAGPAARQRMQAEGDQATAASRVANTQGLPEKQAIVTDSDGTRYLETYVEDADGNRRVISRKNPKTAATIKQEEDMAAATLAATQALATQRSGVGKVRTFQTKMGDPALGRQVTITTSVDGNGRPIRQLVTNQKGETVEVALPEMNDEQDGTGAPQGGVATTQPSAAPAFDPNKGKKPSKDFIDAAKVATNKSRGAEAKALFEKDYGVGSYDYYMNLRE
jgi:hypothetical protein